MTEFTAFILDQLYPLQAISVRKMFGAECLFRYGKMFAIIEHNQLYIKANENTKADFIRENCVQFSYITTRKKQKVSVFLSYYQLPETALEEAEQLKYWVKLGFKSLE